MRFINPVAGLDNPIARLGNLGVRLDNPDAGLYNPVAGFGNPVLKTKIFSLVIVSLCAGSGEGMAAMVPVTFVFPLVMRLLRYF